MIQNHRSRVTDAAALEEIELTGFRNLDA